MKPHIDPKVDCVFKAVLGRADQTAVLVHFLNAVLNPEPDRRICQVTILNPFNEKEFESDKLSVVDVKALDEHGRHYQIEIQLIAHEALLARMLYTWCSIYHALLHEGKDYRELRPVIAIWLVNATLFPAARAYHLPFLLYNPEHQIVMIDHLRMHVVQLPEWRLPRSYDELDRWMYFFTHGAELDVDQPPPILQTEEMQQAMKVLRQFSERERNYWLYQQRLDAQRVEAIRQSELEEARNIMARFNQMQQDIERIEQDKARIEQDKARIEQDKARAEQDKIRIEQEKACAEEEKARAEEEKARIERDKTRIEQENERLVALLKQAGIDPNQ